jgi:hypothetical protein
MSRLFSFLFIAVLLTSCYTENRPEVNPPDKLLSEEVIINMLTDIQLAEGIIVDQRSAKTNVSRSFKDSLYQVIFDHYQVTAQELNENLDYYNNNPEQMEDIYEEVLSRLSQKETEIRMAKQPVDSAAQKK